MALYRVEPLCACCRFRQAHALRERDDSIVCTMGDKDRRLQFPHLLQIIEVKADKVPRGSPKVTMLRRIREGSERTRREEQSARPARRQLGSYGTPD